MKIYLICTMVIWVIGVIQNMREISQKSNDSKNNTIIAASIVQLAFIIWATWLLSNLPA